MSNYTCITCRVMFAAEPGDDDATTRAAALQKEHYKSDWHRYNLKRKVAELPPVTADNFQQRVLAQREQLAEDEKDKSRQCRVCGKHFNSDGAYESHLKSKKHKDAVAKEQSALPPDVARKNEKNEQIKEAMMKAEPTRQNDKSSQRMVVDPSASTEPTRQNDKTSQRMVVDPSASTSRPNEEAESTMSQDGSEEDSWEGDALGLEECLFCTHVSDALESNIKHMTTTHSFFIPDIDYLTDLSGLVTYLGEKVGQYHMCLWCNERGRLFADTRAVQQHMADKGHCKMLHDGDALLEYADFYNYRSSYPDYKEGGGDDEVDMDDEQVTLEKLDDSGYQMVLPSGATVGHRTLVRYYKQKLRPDRQLVLSHNSSALSKVVAHYKALGWTGSTGVAAEKKAKEIAHFKRVESRQFVKLGVRANGLQRHFRDQVFGF